MSKPRYLWWGYVRNIVREFPKMDQELRDLQSQYITQDVSRIRSGKTNGRSTEEAALRSLRPGRQAEHDAVTKAIEQTKRLPNGTERLKLIDMVFWKQSHTLDGASYALGYSYSRARQLQAEFLRLVGINRGLG